MLLLLSSLPQDRRRPRSCGSDSESILFFFTTRDDNLHKLYSGFTVDNYVETFPKHFTLREIESYFFLLLVALLPEIYYAHIDIHHSPTHRSTVVDEKMRIISRDSKNAKRTLLQFDFFLPSWFTFPHTLSSASFSCFSAFCFVLSSSLCSPSEPAPRWRPRTKKRKH